MDIVIGGTGSFTRLVPDCSVGVSQFEAGRAKILAHAHAQLSDFVAGLGGSDMQQFLGVGYDQPQVSGCLLYTSPSPRD